MCMGQASGLVKASHHSCHLDTNRNVGTGNANTVETIACRCADDWHVHMFAMHLLASTVIRHGLYDACCYVCDQPPCLA